MTTASSRLRAYLPCRDLSRAGWDCRVIERPQVPEAHQYDVVIFQKRYDPDSHDLARALRRRGVRVVFDLCDNHYHYALDRPAEQAERARNLDTMIGLSDLVTVSTATLGHVLHERTGVVPVVVDDAVDLPPAPAVRSWRWFHRRRRAGQPLRLVWFGAAGSDQPPFGMVDLARIVPELEDLAREIPLTLTVISNSKDRYRDLLGSSALEPTYRPWRRRTFAYDLTREHLCLIPVTPHPLTLCKTANRPILSLLLGVPVVCDTIPSYEELAPFVAAPPWADALRTHAHDPDLARRQVAEGARFLRRKYTPQRVVRQWGDALSLAGRVPERDRADDPPRETLPQEANHGT